MSMNTERKSNEIELQNQMWQRDLQNQMRQVNIQNHFWNASPGLINSSLEDLITKLSI